MEKITKDTIIGDVVKNNPELSSIFVKHGLSCIGCAFASQETIEQGSNSHELNLDNLLKDLNKKLENNDEKEEEDDEE
ncbi:DUF1858 domain-containing protein [archaeon]|nr:DUF1858 domain-containing protein [archaeon]